ncbi:MAG: hypothetical protein COZ18_14980 [Flexibacter sp. CG_4_10_14_3_um_filter_32_15]|nr:MAG: hypothetical protein COZ18_14980 [Flexibacter sp. CG_4_10_14_3_um_filter_32_15]
MNFKPETVQALEKAFSVNSEDKLLVVTDPTTKNEMVWKLIHKPLARGQYNTQEVTREQFLSLQKEGKETNEKPVEVNSEVETDIAPSEPTEEPSQAKPTKKTK